MPVQRACDAVRFSVARDSGNEITLCFVTERSHLPAAHGCVTYDLAVDRWTCIHPDDRIQKMAECYLKSYLLRRAKKEEISDPTQTND
jgi:hypothetical protein